MGSGAWGAILLAAWAGAAAGEPACPPQEARTVQVGGQSWRVAVACQEADRERGLSGRPRLAAGEGMWFVLPEPGLHGFWMKDMAFAIDLVWVTPELRVAGSARLSPCGDGPCPIHTPPEPVAYVLEINAGRFHGRPSDPVAWRCDP